MGVTTLSFNGSGTFNINTAGQPVVTGTVISSSVFNALTADLATGLSTCITKDGQTTVTANIPMNSFKFTGLAAGTAATDSVRLGQIQAGAATLITVTGTNTYSGTMTPALSAYAAGNTFTFLVPNTNTTSCTLNIDGLGAKSITRDGTTALVAGDLVANSEVVVVYDGTQFQVLNSNSKTNFNLSGTLTVAGNTTLSSGTANGVAYLNGSKVLTTGSALTFNGSTLGLTNASGTELWKLNATTGAAGYMAAGWAAGINVGQWNIYTTSTDPITVGCQGSAGITFATSSANRVTINAAGNFTINAPASGTALTVSGAVQANGDASGVGYYLGTSATAIRYNTNADNYIDYSFGGSTGGLRFRRGAAVAETMILDNSGNVGIGTSSPGARLTVSSTASTYAVDISSTNTSINNRTLNVYNSAATGTTALTNQLVRLASNGSGADCTLQFTDSVATNGYIGMKSGALNFGANTTTTQMTLDTSGNLLVGTTSASFNSSNSTFFYPTTGYWVVNHANGTSTGTRYIGFGYNTGEIGSITQNGTTGVLYNITSDYRLKEFVAPITNAGERIDALNPVEFNWKSDGSRARGFFAHEFQQVYASSVTGEKDAVDEDGNPVYQKMQASTAEVIADLVAEIKSLRQRVAQLEVK